MDLPEKYRDSNILIWGYGREGKSTEAFFKKHPIAASVDVSEAKPEEIDWSAYDYVFKSPGIRLAEPVWERLSAGPSQADKSVLDKLTSQTELFIESFRDRVIGITGTKGKSTTTSLLHHVLDKKPRTAYLVGNIGVPCLDFYDEMAASDSIAVFELSCHQLAYSRVSPHISIFLNLYEDHLDFYGDRATYFQAKRHITEFQDENDYLFMGNDVPELSTRAKVLRVAKPYADEAMNLLGEHNRYNAAFVAEVAKICFGMEDSEVRKAVEEFPGLPHRLQYIGTVDGVRYYDDSISTIPEATIQAVNSVPGVATVLVGGMDREIDYSPLISFIPDNQKVNFICMYVSGKRVYDEVMDSFAGGNHLSIDNDDSSGIESGKDSTDVLKNKAEGINNMYLVSDLAEAVSLAKQITPSGSACVLSPAAASYGYFKNFEERGDRFRELVNTQVSSC
ncbi:MAG: UDP-N-acetylmuramoyl-L-alanine--D-glutamate ligase [Eubacterium sp.]|nr:UDP-N-acetylmuramoyl-L-alanine--D-glutamate ligase [Eubacterium sp.]